MRPREMTAAEQKKAAREFAEKWSGRGYEKGECQKFWRSLLHDVFGITDPDDIAAIFYNNFPWPGGAAGVRALPECNGTSGTNGASGTNGTSGTDETENPVNPVNPVKEKITATAQAILDARALYPDSSLADLYDPITMPPELRKAHRANDAAVLAAYGFPPDITELEIVSRLFGLYSKLTEKE